MGKMDLSRVKLPPIYKRNGKNCYLDPIREKLIENLISYALIRDEYRAQVIREKKQ